jgi:hypothetical protein
VLRLRLDAELMYAYHVTPKVVAESVERMSDYKVRCLYTPFGGLPIKDLAGGKRRRSLPVIDVYVAFGAKGRAKGRPVAGAGRGKPPASAARPRAAAAEVVVGDAGEGSLAFASEPEYKLREVFGACSAMHVAGIGGIQQLHPYFLPLVRFFSVAAAGPLADGTLVAELRFDQTLMKTEGVKGSQIEAYARWRIDSLAAEDVLQGKADGPFSRARLRSARGRILVEGLNKEQAELIKSYSAIEPLTTFASLESDEAEGEASTLRVVQFRIDKDRLRRYGFFPDIGASAKLMSLVLRELQPERFSVEDNLVTIWVDTDGDKDSYRKLVKPSSLPTFTRILTDTISDLQKEEHQLEVEVLDPAVLASRQKKASGTPGLSKLPLSRVIQAAVRESGAFDVRERSIGKRYLLTLTLSKKNYERFILAHDAELVRVANGKKKLAWETEIFVDVSTIIPSYNTWSYQTIGSNLKAVLALKEVNERCTTTDDPNEVFALFGIEATAAYLVTQLNTVTNGNRDVDIRNFSLVVDTMCAHAVPASVSRHGLAEQGAEAMTKAAMEQATRTFQMNGFTGEQDSGQSPASCLLMGTKIKLGAEVADVRLRQTMLPLGAVERESTDERVARQRSTAPPPKARPGVSQSLLAGASRARRAPGGAGGASVPKAGGRLAVARLDLE